MFFDQEKFDIHQEEEAFSDEEIYQEDVTKDHSEWAEWYFKGSLVDL